MLFADAHKMHHPHQTTRRSACFLVQRGVGFEGKKRELGSRARKRVAKEETTGRKQTSGKKDNLQSPLPFSLKFNAWILSNNLTHPTQKTTTHATSENNKGKRRPQITSNYRDFGPFAAIYPMKTWLALRYCTTRPGHNNAAKIRDRQPGCGLTICPIKALPVWRTCFTRQFTTTLSPPSPRHLFFKLNA